MAPTLHIRDSGKFELLDDSASVVYTIRLKKRIIYPLWTLRTALFGTLLVNFCTGFMYLSKDSHRTKTIVMGVFGTLLLAGCLLPQLFMFYSFYRKPDTWTPLHSLKFEAAQVVLWTPFFIMLCVLYGLRYEVFGDAIFSTVVYLTTWGLVAYSTVLHFKSKKQMGRGGGNRKSTATKLDAMPAQA
ncbi:hypothetical protein EJ06DRAFT_551416 [Trichodelitschia bisporula]|uniref:Uncharacterized protein n=1 Tax=Trichodelitschia bisporula TaxID=703511 RepID=A0A6G1HLZ4_9PEZI|nr:hypothetical protein EJ06DRAFT_551416 [Trichodelitschia bisporula]